MKAGAISMQVFETWARLQTNTINSSLKIMKKELNMDNENKFLREEVN